MRIWKIGFGKTGTTSLHKALQHLGFRSCHDNTMCDQAVDAALRGDWPRLLDRFDAFVDGEEAQRNFAEMAATYPEDKFILTTRNVEHWLDSKMMSVLYHRTSHPQRAAGLNIDTAAMRTEFQQHEEAVRDYFADNPESLLVFNCCDGNDGYPELAAFLGRNISAREHWPEWPRANVSFTKLQVVRDRFKQRAKRKR